MVGGMGRICQTTFFDHILLSIIAVQWRNNHIVKCSEIVTYKNEINLLCFIHIFWETWWPSG